MCTRLPSTLVGLKNRMCCTGPEVLIPLLGFSRCDKSVALTKQFLAVSTCSSTPGEAVRSRKSEQQRYHKAPGSDSFSQS